MWDVAFMFILHTYWEVKLLSDQDTHLNHFTNDLSMSNQFSRCVDARCKQGILAGQMYNRWEHTAYSNTIQHLCIFLTSSFDSQGTRKVTWSRWTPYLSRMWERKARPTRQACAQVKGTKNEGACERHDLHWKYGGESNWSSDEEHSHTDTSGLVRAERFLEFVFYWLSAQFRHQFHNSPSRLCIDVTELLTFSCFVLLPQGSETWLSAAQTNQLQQLSHPERPRLAWAYANAHSEHFTCVSTCSVRLQTMNA